jgi:cytochrome P450
LLEYGFAPRRFASRHAAKFGRVYRLRALPKNGLFTADPEHVRRIFAADESAFETPAAVTLSGLFGPRSVLLTSGALHRRQRKLLAPPLNGARLRAFGASMQKLAEQHVATLTPGLSFRALNFTTAFTLDVIVRTVFGVNDAEEERALRSMLSVLVHQIPPLPLYMPLLQHPWFPPWGSYLRAQQHFESWLTAKIAQRRREGGSGEDVLSLLLETRYEDGSAMDDLEVRDQLLTLLLAGHETTAITLATCLNRLYRHPDVLARVQAELAAHSPAPEAVVRLPYLSAVVDETLRIDPVVTDVGRIPVADFALDTELVVTSKHVLIVLIEALHHDPTLYPEPSRFRPERFLERKYMPHEFAPFGGGVRRCLGAAFSDYETKIMLAALLQRLNLKLADPRPEPRVRRNVTMGPKRGVPMRVESVR